MEKNKEERMKSQSLETVKIDLVWGIVLFFVAGHLAAIYGLYLVFTSAKLLTLLFGEFKFIFIFIRCQISEKKMYFYFQKLNHIFKYS